MSMFVHRCTECGHNQMNHEPQQYKGSACSHGWCPCGRTIGQITGPPELIPTFDGVSNSESQRVVAPGEKFGPPALSGGIACDCADCRQAYASLTGGVA